MDSETRINQVILRQWKSQRETVTGIGWYYRRFWPYYVFQIALFGSLAAISWYAGSDELAVGFIGLFTGVFLRDIYWFRRSLASRGTLDAIIDWDLVDDILDSHERPPT